MARYSTKFNWTVTIFAMVFAALLLVGPHRASADSISFDIGGPGNPGGLSCCTGPYAVVTVDRTSNTQATVTFDSYTNGGFIYLMADGGSVAVNVNATTWTVGSITGTNSIAGFTPGPYSDGGAGNENGFGSFNQKIDSFDGFTNSATHISFVLTDTSGTWASAGNVLTANADGFIAAIHGFACAIPGCSTTSGAFATGFAAGDGRLPPTQIPEPSALLLLGAGLCVIASVARRLS